MPIRDDLSLVHLVRQPSRPADGSVPLLLLLHDVGSNEQDLFGLAPHSTSGWSWSARARR
jgi:predicted esterase